MKGWRPRALIILVAIIPVGIIRAKPDDVNTLQARFDREGNSVHKAKLLEKLGDAQLELTRRASQANDFKTIGFVMEKYRDNARVAIDALKKDHRDAEHHRECAARHPHVYECSAEPAQRARDAEAEEGAQANMLPQ